MTGGNYMFKMFKLTCYFKIIRFTVSLVFLLLSLNFILLKAVFGQEASGTIVDIANPKSSGLSHNRFEQYSVSADGVVINNSLEIIVSKRSNIVNGNEKLDVPAKIIVFQVVARCDHQSR